MSDAATPDDTGRALEQSIGSYFTRLTDAQCERLHEATLQVLERTGLIVDDAEALGLLAAAGADVNGTRVRIHPEMVERALATAPREVTLYDRNGEPRLVLAGRRTYYGTGSDCMYCFDHRTRERRRAVLQDIDQRWQGPTTTRKT